MLKQIFFWLAFSWTAVVLVLCLVQLNDVPTVGIQNVDKYVHTFFHFVFTFLWFLFLKEQFKNQYSGKPYVVSFLFSVFFGIAIEIAQGLFTISRKSDLFDILANVTGAALAVLVLWIYFRKKH
ncbi:VanZ family protein [Flavobacterium granuli]|uniref:VanZ family protein n=1 Tax=Flavobacterium granuli TaxID=280093 RepID=UPI0009FF10A4|nr:VanZ family protein [Flavobacterium granuli]